MKLLKVHRCVSRVTPGRKMFVGTLLHRQAVLFVLMNYLPLMNLFAPTTPTVARHRAFPPLVVLRLLLQNIVLSLDTNAISSN